MLRNGCRGARANAVSLVKKEATAEFRPDVRVTWVRVVVMELVRSG